MLAFFLRGRKKNAPSGASIGFWRRSVLLQCLEKQHGGENAAFIRVDFVPPQRVAEDPKNDPETTLRTDIFKLNEFN